MSDELAENMPKCGGCGKPMHRSRAKTLFERLGRSVLGRKKYRCDKCGRIKWFAKAPRSEAWRARAEAEALRIRRDPMARRATRLRWRRKAIVVIVAVLGGSVLGVMLARSQENSSQEVSAAP